jgi:tetratricopeptide (TPR) repeat protein
VSDNDGAFPGPDDFQEEPDDSPEETVGEALADYLSLIDETIRIQLTDDDIRDWARRAMDLAVSGPDPSLDHVRGPGFSDRHLLRDELMALMGDPQQGPVVLAGPGGTGKTTMATDLAEHARALGQDVWWISAADPVTLLRGLAAVARQLGKADDVDAIARDEADAADRFWRLLENASSEWLLIFDEADDPQVLAAGRSPAGVQDLTGWVRSSARGLALVTSRETDPRMWEAARLLRVGELPEADAVQMLLELAPAAGDESEARALARRLSRHPLSLRLAGRFLHSQAAQGATFAAYGRALDEQAVLNERPGRHAPAPLALTARALELSLGGLAQQGIPQTRPVLQLASCYAAAPIPASLLNSRSLAETGLLTDFGGTSPTAEDRAGEALRELQITGILEPADGGIGLHSAIIEAGRASMGGSGPASARIRQAAIELLHDRTSKLPYEDPESWPQYLLLGPHLLSLLDNAGQVDRKRLGWLMETTARTVGAFNLKGMSRAGIILGERAFARSAPLGAEHRAVLRVRHAMTWAVAYHGDLDTAEARYRQDLQTRLRVLGPDDPDVLSSRHELAWIAACRKDWATAEAGYREALKDSVRLLGPDDPQTLLTRHELAWAIANQERSRLGEAREIFDTVLGDRRRVLGAEHPRTLTTLHELAWISAQDGKWEQAETAYRELLDLRGRVLGEDHQDTMVIRHELAWIAARRGRTADAESRYSDVLDQRRRILGEEHPDTLATQDAQEELRRGRIIDARHLA